MKWRIRLGLALVIVVQTIVYLLAGAGKIYIHMDEAYSLALAQYDKIDITANEDFYDTWHTDQYYQDYLAVQEKDAGDWRPVWENQKNDVHPPLYYILLRLAMTLAPGEFSKWPGIGLNIIIMGVGTVLLYLILRRLLAREKAAEWKALAVTLAAGLTVAAVSTAVYIRMYGLLTLMILLTLWLYLWLGEKKSLRWWDYGLIVLVAVFGTLTQYYYLFFLFGLAVVTTVQKIRQRDFKSLAKYIGSLVLAGGIVLLLWPAILQHLFFGYRGQGAMSNLLNPLILVQHLWDYVLIIDYNVFHRTLGVLVAAVAVMAFYRLSSKTTYKISLTSPLALIVFPTCSYFILAAVASPYIELRYMMPICGLVFALMMYILYILLAKVLREKWRNIALMATMAVVLVAAPVQLGLKWMRIELLYRDRREVMTAVATDPEVPILYFITTENNRFLDNILPFTVAKTSYLALDLKTPKVEEVQKILRGKDLGAGLLVFVSDQQDHQLALDAVQAATGLETVKWVQGINTCDVYYLQ